MLYRVMTDLSLGGGRTITRGSVSNLANLKEHVIELLLKRRAITIVSAPPISELPGWDSRAKRLSKHGIITVNDLLSYDENRLAVLEDVSVRTVRRWMKEASDWIKGGG